MSKILDFNGLRRYDEQIKNWVESGLPIKNADLGSQEFNPKAGIYYHGIGINKDIYKCTQEATTVYVSLDVGQTFSNGDAIHFDVNQAAELTNFLSNLEYPESGAHNLSLLHGTNYLELLAMKVELEEGSGHFVYAIGVGDAKKVVFATEDIDSGSIHAVAGFNNLDENGNYIFTGLHDGDDYTVNAEIQSLYEDEALLSTFVTTAEVGHVIPPVMEKVILNGDLDAKADLVNGKVPVEEIPDLPVYRNFPSSWPTNGTTAAFAAAVNADPDAVVGTSYLGDVRFSDLPFGSGSANGELIVDVIGGSVSEKVIHLTLTSGNAKPYRWEYTYWVQAGTAHNSGWIDFQDVFYGADMTALNALKLRQKKANALYVAGDTNAVYRWNATLSQFVQVGGASDYDILQHKPIINYVYDGYFPNETTDLQYINISPKLPEMEMVNNLKLHINLDTPVAQMNSAVETVFNNGVQLGEPGDIQYVVMQSQDENFIDLNQSHAWCVAYIQVGNEDYGNLEDAYVIFVEGSVVYSTTDLNIRHGIGLVPANTWVTVVPDGASAYHYRAMTDEEKHANLLQMYGNKGAFQCTTHLPQIFIPSFSRAEIGLNYHKGQSFYKVFDASDCASDADIDAILNGEV